MRSFQIVLLTAALLGLSACAQKRPTVLSGTNALQMQSSIQLLRANLAPLRQEEFDQAVATIIYSAKDRRLYQSNDRLTPESIRMLKGLNAHQVIETAKLLRTASGAL